MWISALDGWVNTDKLRFLGVKAEKNSPFYVVGYYDGTKNCLISSHLTEEEATNACRALVNKLNIHHY